MRNDVVVDDISATRPWHHLTLCAMCNGQLLNKQQQRNELQVVVVVVVGWRGEAQCCAISGASSSSFVDL